MKRNPLDCIHETFLFFLRAFFRKVGFFVGSNPWSVIVSVNLFTVFCFYGALSNQWPYFYNPLLNDNVLTGLDAGFAQQDGTPLLNKQWAAAKFGDEKFASIMAFADSPDSMLHTDVRPQRSKCP